MFSTRLKDGFRQKVLGFGDLIVDAWGRQKVVNDYSLFHGLFTNDVPYQMWLKYEDGIEVSAENAVSSYEGMLRVFSNDNVSSCQSKRHPRYQPNRGLLYSSSILLPDAGADAVREFGCGTEFNSVFFRLKLNNGSPTLYACRRFKYLGARTTVEEEITDLPNNFDIEKGNIYDIQMQWRGVGNIKFYVGDPDTGVSKLVHKMKLLGTLDKLSITDPAMPLFFKSEFVTENSSLYCGCVDLTSEGGFKQNRQLASVTSQDQVSLTNGVEIPVLAISVSQILNNGNLNTRDNALRRLTYFTTNTATCSGFLTRDASRFSGTIWTDRDSQGHIKYSSNGDVSFDDTGLNRFTFRRIGENTSIDADNPDDSYGDLYLTSGDYLVLTMEAKGGNGLGGATIWWGEEI